MNLQQLAEKISDNTEKKNSDYGIDPFTISIIITIVTNLIKLWWACRDEKSIRSELQRPSLVFKLLLKREIRKRARREDRGALYGAFMEITPRLTEEDINNIMKEIGEQE
jgi:hypothetical protein